MNKTDEAIIQTASDMYIAETFVLILRQLSRTCSQGAKEEVDKRLASWERTADQARRGLTLMKEISRGGENVEEKLEELAKLMDECIDGWVP